MVSAIDAGHTYLTVYPNGNNLRICWCHSFTNHYTPRTPHTMHHADMHCILTHACTHVHIHWACRWITFDLQYIHAYLSKLRQSKTYGLSGLKRTSRSWNISSHFSLLCLIRIKYCWHDECCIVMSSWRTSPMTGNLSGSSFTKSRTVVSERLYKGTLLHHNTTLGINTVS